MIDEQTEVPVEAEIQQIPEEPQLEEQPLKEAAKADVDRNWERANDVLRAQQQKIAELEGRITEFSRPKAQEEVDEFANLDQDDYMTVGKARELANKTASKEASKAARRAVEEYDSQRRIIDDESRMRAKHDDYDYVIDNIVLPELKNDPALAYKIQQSKNPAETAYKIGKLSDRYEETAMKKETSPRAEKILKNASRPLSSSAAGSHLKSQVQDFSKMSKEDIWLQSQKYAKGA